MNRLRDSIEMCKARANILRDTAAKFLKTISSNGDRTLNAMAAAMIYDALGDKVEFAKAVRLSHAGLRAHKASERTALAISLSDYAVGFDRDLALDTLGIASAEFYLEDGTSMRGDIVDRYLKFDGRFAERERSPSSGRQFFPAIY